MRLYGSSEAAPAPVVPAERARLLQWFGAVQDLNPAYLEPEDHQLAERLRGTVSEGPPAQDPEFVALMAMSEAEIDAELRALGIDPETAARKAAGAIAEGVARARCRGYICRLCGKDTPHHHTAEEVVIFRNGVKFARHDRRRRGRDVLARQHQPGLRDPQQAGGKMSADTRKAFEAWWADAGRVLVVKPEVAELIWLASRSQALEEAALIAEKTYAKDAFRFVLGTEAAAAIRKLGAQE
jgi:hypothetical protein